MRCEVQRTIIELAPFLHLPDDLHFPDHADLLRLDKGTLSDLLLQVRREGTP